jgi:hypothetical protein
MKLFISWSGDISKQVANILHDWIPSVIQVIEPFLSSEDLEKGDRWLQKLMETLESTDRGIVCVTKASLQSPWVNFEVGALSKKSNAIVYPFLFGLDRAALGSSPLSCFQSTKYEKSDVQKLICKLNKDSSSTINESKLLQDFENIWWPILDQKFQEVYQLTQKKIVWVHESRKSEVNANITPIQIEGIGSQQQWYLDETHIPKAECNILVYVFCESPEAPANLRKAINYALGLQIPMIVYAPVRLSAEEIKIVQEHCKLANTPPTLTDRLKEVI